MILTVAQLMWEENVPAISTKTKAAAAVKGISHYGD